MEFIWENRDIAKILIDGAEGTRYVNFREVCLYENGADP